MTDKQLDKLIKQLDRRLMRLHEECDRAIDDLSYVIGQVKTLREERDENRRRWLAS